MGKMQLLYANAVGCFEDMMRIHTVQLNVQGYKQLQTVKIEFPEPAAFNSIKHKLTQQATEQCKSTRCIKVCEDKVCISYACEQELEICYNGEFSVSVTNGNTVVEATLN